MGSISENLEHVRARIAAACAKAHRDPASVTLVAVSKTKPVEAIRAAYEAGQRDFGENYAQELAKKREALADLPAIRWHFIGALQSNKAKLVVPGTALVHAIDRASTAEALGKRARASGQIAEALVEVNVAGEASKAGVPMAEVELLLAECGAIDGLRIRGLMCIPPPADDPEASRPHFRALRGLSDRLASQHPSLGLLSMGMSDDFEIAVEEGATHVRVGTAIFGEREYAR